MKKFFEYDGKPVRILPVIDKIDQLALKNRYYSVFGLPVYCKTCFLEKQYCRCGTDQVNYCCENCKKEFVYLKKCNCPKENNTYELI